MQLYKEKRESVHSERYKQTELQTNIQTTQIKRQIPLQVFYFTKMTGQVYMINIHAKWKELQISVLDNWNNNVDDQHINDKF